MYQYFKKQLTDNDTFWSKLRNNTIFVLPAFESFLVTNNDNNNTEEEATIPNTKEELRKALRKKQASTFHPYFIPGHYPTNYKKWLFPSSHDGDDDDFSYTISYQKRYEPYVLAYKHGLPEFWNGFRGFGYNAATWFWELNSMSYKFEVLSGNYFVVHRNHP